MTSGDLWSVDAPHFCCGLVVLKGKIIEAAPILRWSVGKSWTYFKQYAKHKGWEVLFVCFTSKQYEGGDAN